MNIHNNTKIPLGCLVLVIGPPNSGKSEIVRMAFYGHEQLRHDVVAVGLYGCQDASVHDFVNEELIRQALFKLSIGERVVIDSELPNNVRVELVSKARQLGVRVFYLMIGICEYAKSEVDEVVEIPEQLRVGYRRYYHNLRNYLKGDGMAEVIDCRNNNFEVVHKPPNYNLLRYAKLGFNGITVIGDIHGCLEQLVRGVQWALGRNNLIVFLGDIVDYGPFSIECVNVVYEVLVRGQGIMVMGNHEKKIAKWLRYQRSGKQSSMHLSDANKVTTSAISALSENDRVHFETKFNTICNLAHEHFVIGNTVMVHGGACDKLFDIYAPKLFGSLHSLVMYGEVNTSETDQSGYPVRTYDWIDTIPNGKMVIMGHDIRSMDQPTIVQGKLGGTVVFMDCGCGKGGPSFAVDLNFEDDKLAISCFIKN